MRTDPMADAEVHHGSAPHPPDHRWARRVVAATVALRLVAVAGLPLHVYVDSAEYGTIDFTGRGRRPWATPLLFWLVPGGDGHLVVAQAIIGGLCWAALALSAAAWFRLPATRLVVATAVVALGSATAVTNWDTTKLSESLGLSLTALVVAAWLHLLRRPGARRAALVLVATVPWLFVRHGMMPAAWLVVVAAGAGAARSWRRGDPSRVFAGTACAMALLVGLASASYGRNPGIVQQNLTGIVAARVAPDAGRLAWFVDHGMPVPASGRLDYRTLRRDAAFGRWAADEGPSTYVRYLATHPAYTAARPVDDLLRVEPSLREERKVQATTLSPGHPYGSARNVEPDQLENLVFAPGRTGTVLTAIVATVAWTVASRRRRHRGWVVPTLLVAISLASLIASWNGSVPEQPRHAIVSAVALRIGLILQLGMLAEAEVLARRQAASDREGVSPPASPPPPRPVGVTS